MAHPRKLIRLAIVAQLIAANTAAGSRVYPDRVDPHKSGATPAICVYTLSEPVDQAASNAQPRQLKRELQVEVAGYVTGVDEEHVVDALDDLAEEIEKAIDTDPRFGGKANEAMLEDTVVEVRAENGRSDPLVGIIVLTYTVTYRTDSFAAPVELDEFLRVKATHKFVGTQSEGEDANAAVDKFTVQGSAPWPDEPEEPPP